MHARRRQRGHKLAVYLLDLERFKNINDTLGQSAGDALLKQVAAWLIDDGAEASQLARTRGGPVRRRNAGGRARGGRGAAAREDAVSPPGNPVRPEGRTFRVAAKVGVALFPDDGDSAEDLLKNAEAALKKAKASGDPYLFYAQRMTERRGCEAHAGKPLRQALDDGEFVLHYQPKVSSRPARSRARRR